ncbi:carbohydrate ABC transporter permease [Portibacter marinus]|uniref:carbohydrate ABC transporter permease n=1 Tax=Portibacter marinus TaxID=2898660 RepID=UPI001F232B87|nr:carbohydrate ABC transporter permease [Portibacter marinus]
MRRLKKILFYFILTIAALTFLYPFYWMIVASLTPEENIGNLSLVPQGLTFDHYSDMVEKIPIWRALFNSLLVATISTFGVLVFGSMTGYALAKMRFKGRNLLFFTIIFTMTLPFQITLIPNYIIMVNFKWVDTLAALIVPALNSAFAILLFRQAFLTIPDDLIHAARVDGCGDLRIIFQILWPNILPSLITVGILTFMTSWNDVLWPLIVIRQEELMTMPQLVTLFAVGGRSEAQLGVKLASAVLLALPIIIAYIFLQKYFIQSMASSGIKA